MLTLSALASAGLLAVVCAADPAPGTGDVRIEAGTVTYSESTGRLLVEGGAVLRRGAIVLRARTAEVDVETGEVVATGGVLLTDATRAIAAEGVRAVLGGDFEADGVVAFLKEGAVDLSQVADRGVAARAGRNRASLSGAHLAGDASGRLRLTGARLTLCDCPSGAPSWEIRARKADVIAGERAILSWPVLRITPPFVNRSIPVLVLPWLYLPLGERHTGFLFPSFSGSSATGFSFAEPLFITLGQSADLTLTPSYAFGWSRPGGPTSAPVRGPGLAVELRWAPAPGVSGLAELAWTQDLEDEVNGASGARYALTLRHGQQVGASGGLRLDAALYGDELHLRDFNVDVLSRAARYRRSSALLDLRSDAGVLEIDVAYLQPLSPDVAIPGYGPFGADLPRAHRWPGVSATLSPLAAGPLRLLGRAGISRYAPVSGADADDAGRLAATRGDVRAEVSLPTLLGGALSVEPYLRGAALGYAFDAGDGTTAAWGIAGARVGTVFARSFGRVRHVIAPRLDWRIGSGVAGEGLGAPAYDALDRSGIAAAAAAGAARLLSAAPAGPFQQLRLSVENRLTRGAGDLLRLELGQDVDLRRGEAAESFVTAAAAAGPLTADATARFLAFDRWSETGRDERLTELRAGAALRDVRGDALTASVLALGPGGSGALAAGLDALFDLRTTSLPASPGAPYPPAFTQLAAGARAVVGAATVGYDAQLAGRPTILGCRDGRTRAIPAGRLYEHAASVLWDSPCKCFRLLASARLNDCDEFSYGATIDLSQLGQRVR